MKTDQQQLYELSKPQKIPRILARNTSVVFRNYFGQQPGSVNYSISYFGFIKAMKKAMKCENLQFNLPLYAENILADEERQTLETHLTQCPVCRAGLADFKALRRDLRNLPAPEIPPDLLSSVKNSVTAELKRSSSKSTSIFSANFRRWLQYRLMPYSVGTAASLLITFSLLLTLLSTREATRTSVENARLASNRSVLIAANSNSTIPGALYEGDEYSLGSLPVGDESPTINPASALVALTKSIARGKMKDEEVVVVADVFGDGIAKIAEVVEPPQDKGALRDLKKALDEKQVPAPFVPASQDNRAQVVRVIFKIQRVDVIEKSAKSDSKNR